MNRLIEKLEIKPIPIKTDGIIINVPIKDVTMDDESKTTETTKLYMPIKIIDKTAEAFNRDSFMERIKAKILVAPKLIIGEVTDEITPIPKTEGETTTDVDTSSVVEKPKFKSRKIGTFKLSKRIKKGTITGTVGERPLRKGKKKKRPIIAEVPETMFKIGDTIINERLEKDDSIKIRAPAYYMNNREAFVNFINVLFMQYKDELLEESKTLTCESRKGGKFNLLTHQKVVSDYLNLYTPYRGLLLYHGLGSGKTCSSIAIAEGMKTEKVITVLTPAALRANYIEQLKFCGDSIYKKNQFWEFIDTSTYPEHIDALTKILSLDRDFITTNGGAWLVNATKETNYDTLSRPQKENLDVQLDEMIRHKYRFINYNGLRKSLLNTLTHDGTINPFDNQVVIIDEVHNFISRIVNKLKRPDSMSMKLYEYLMSAQNTRLVFLTGTPIINYPNEIGILFNMLRGYITTLNIHLNVASKKTINKEYFQKLFGGYAIYDNVEYTASNNTLSITRNPFGFMTKLKRDVYKGVKLDERGQVDDATFQKKIISILLKDGFKVNKRGIKVNLYKALPDNLDEFKALFIDSEGAVKNTNMFKRRILGLTSYFRDIEELMPKYDEHTDFNLIKIEMSDDQFQIYEGARQAERKQEKNNAKRFKKRATSGANTDVYNDAVSTYRIFSRLFCNFVFPTEIKRPLPNESEKIDDALKKADESIVDAIKVEERINKTDGKYTEEDIEELKKADEKAIDETYNIRIKKALSKLKKDGDKYLTPEALKTYSPKFLHMLQTIQDVKNNGLHLIYSQFRTIEGIGIMKLILEQNGFAQFKIKKSGDTWVMDIADEDKGKPMFGLYTGTEESEEKEIIRNIFNGTWEYIPLNIRTELKKISTNNNYGEIIKVLMITSAGAEGVNLKNVRFVHLTEPYWHPVRLEQVIGRARRICSHENLTEADQNIKVFLYLMTLSKLQKESDDSIELRLKDKSKIDKFTPLTTDEALYEISTIKQMINKQLLHSIKEASIDCALHTKTGTAEPLKCFTFGSASPDTMSYHASYTSAERDDMAELNTSKITWKAKSVKLAGKVYALRLNPDGTRSNKIYDIDSYKLAIKHPGVNPTFLGILKKEGRKYIIETEV